MIRVPRVLPILAALLLAAGLFGCAHAPQGPAMSPEALWRAFDQRRVEARQDTVGILADASLHYADGNRAHRMTLKLWGSPRLPLRMDLRAGVGTTLAMLREERGAWLGYFPQENAAYTSQSALFGQRVLGMDLPFTLRDLAGLVAGTCDGFAPKTPKSGKALPHGGAEYALQGNGTVTSMTLDAQGRPVVFAGRLHGRKWTMTLSGHADTVAAAPAKIDISLEPDVRAIVRIKHLERRAAPWPNASLDLPLPPGAKVMPLDAPEQGK